MNVICTQVYWQHRNTTWAERGQHWINIKKGNEPHIYQTRKVRAPLVLTGHARLALMVNVLSAALILVGGSIAAKSFGPSGLAMFAAITIILQSFLHCWLTRRFVGVWPSAILFPWLVTKTGIDG